MTTPNGWQGQSNPAQNNPAQGNPAQPAPGQQAPQGYPQQAPSSASAHHPAGPAGYGQGQPYGARPPAQPKQPLDLSKIFNLGGLVALGVALVLLVLGLIFTLTGTNPYSEEGIDRSFIEVKKLYYVGQTFLTTGVGIAVIGAAAYVGSLVQGLTAKLKK